MPDAPAFVVEEDFADPLWVMAARKTAAERTDLERMTFAAGPRPHPFGPNAHTVTDEDGRVMHFADEAAYHAHAADAAQ